MQLSFWYTQAFHEDNRLLEASVAFEKNRLIAMPTFHFVALYFNVYTASLATRGHPRK
jgi:hypothetical protein